MEATYKPPSGLAGPSTWDAGTVQEWLTKHASAISQGHSIDPSTDLFAQGFDRWAVLVGRHIAILSPFCSLSVTYLRNRLFSALGSSPDSKIRDTISRISPNIIFENPTLELLATRIANLVDKHETPQCLNLKQQRVQAMDAMIEKYSIGLSGFAASVDGTSHDGIYNDRAVVLLSGSTGGLGSFLLSRLIENPAVERVYALNRPSSGSIEERQRSAFADRGLSVDLLDSAKLVYVEAETSRDGCGFSAALYEEVLICITLCPLC